MFKKISEFLGFLFWLLLFLVSIVFIPLLILFNLVVAVEGEFTPPLTLLLLILGAFEVLLFLGLPEIFFAIGINLKFVPRPLRTAKVCRAAVEENGEALEYVPEPLRTAELCRAAVKKKGKALKYVPEYLRTAELCRAAVDDILRELYPAAVEQGYVPESLRTADLCRAVVEQKGWALKYVPGPLRTAELCRAAVEQDGGGA